jgi:outer membrane PBP1 activator LpoA protein
MADINSMQELLKLQQELTQRLGRQLETIDAKQKPILDAVLGAANADVAAAKEALAQAQKERDTVVKYWDDRIARLSAQADGKSQELNTAQARIKAAGSGQPAASGDKGGTPG